MVSFTKEKKKIIKEKKKVNFWIEGWRGMWSQPVRQSKVIAFVKNNVPGLLASPGDTKTAGIAQEGHRSRLSAFYPSSE